MGEVIYMPMKTIKLALLSASLCAMTACSQAGKSDFDLHVITDNAQPRVMSRSLFASAPDSLMSALGLTEGVPSSVSCILLRHGGETILFDSGNGHEDSRLNHSLDSLGIKPEEVGLVFLTHLHGDHVGGLIRGGQRVFAHATLYIPAQEYAAWETQTGDLPKHIAKLKQLYGDDIHLFEEGSELPHGIIPVPAYGHTAGHTAYRIGKILIAGDIMHGVALQLKHPQHCAKYDKNPEEAIITRRTLLEMAQREGLTLYGMHFPDRKGITPAELLQAKEEKMK